VKESHNISTAARSGRPAKYWKRSP